jgi:hypothetical protein
VEPTRLHSNCPALPTHSSASPIARRIARSRRRHDVSFRCKRHHREIPKVWPIPYLGVREAMQPHFFFEAGRGCSFQRAPRESKALADRGLLFLSRPRRFTDESCGFSCLRFSVRSRIPRFTICSNPQCSYNEVVKAETRWNPRSGIEPCPLRNSALVFLLPRLLLFPSGVTGFA